jgi:hypothetical protein
MVVAVKPFWAIKFFVVSKIADSVRL